MRNFQVYELSPQVFVQRAHEVLKARGYDDVVSLELEGVYLRVGFVKMGRTDLVYHLDSVDDGFIARLENKRVAPFHAPFVTVFESQFENVVQGAGGRLLC